MKEKRKKVASEREKGRKIDKKWKGETEKVRDRKNESKKWKYQRIEINEDR